MGKPKLFIKRFTRDAILVSVALALLVVGIIIYLSVKANRYISDSYMDVKAQKAATQFADMRKQGVGSLEMVRGWGTGGLIDLKDPKQVEKLLLPVFEPLPMLSAILLADTHGGYARILRDGVVPEPEGGAQFDATDRPWFKPAVESDTVVWTDIYRFYSSDRQGLTASVAWPEKKGKDYFVAAFDILLEDLFTAIEQIPPTPKGHAFIFLQSEGVAAASEIENPLVQQALDLWSHDDEAVYGDVAEPVKLVDNGAVWWCGFVPLESSRGNIWMGVLIPESDIGQDVSRRRSILIGIGLFSVLAIAGLNILLVRRFGSELRAVGGGTKELSVASVLALIEKGENRAVEFKSTLRMNLHSKKPGKEIELAWLKGIAAFLNTDGGTLLIGVTDDGAVTGLEQDVFENEDKCRLHFKNLIAAHLGAEHSKYIRFSILSVFDKTVGVVQCSRSSDPVFLKDGNKEAFYIRNGPSSDELPVSQALRYIEHRN